MSAKKIEESNLLNCPETGRVYLASEFPKMCNCCKKEFHNRDSYWEETVALTGGNYSKGTKDHIFEYRNCNDCQSTLVTKFLDERDNSAEGSKSREEWTKKFQFLVSNGISEDRAKSILVKKKS